MFVAAASFTIGFLFWGFVVLCKRRRRNHLARLRNEVEMERIVKQQQPVTVQPELFRVSNEVAVQVVAQEVQENISQQILPPSTTSQNRRSMRTTNIPVRLGITSK